MSWAAVDVKHGFYEYLLFISTLSNEMGFLASINDVHRILPAYSHEKSNGVIHAYMLLGKVVHAMNINGELCLDN